MRESHREKDKVKDEWRLCVWRWKIKLRYLVIPDNSRDVRDNENRVMYNEESVTLLKGDVERPCLRG